MQTAGERTVVGIDIEDADWHVIASRNIPVIIEPPRLNPQASELADPLKDLHDTLDRAQDLIDTADVGIGTVTTLVPSKKATGALTGTGWKRKLNLGIPRGSKISSVTATALDTATPTVTTGTDANGDTPSHLVCHVANRVRRATRATREPGRRADSQRTSDG